MNKDLGPDFKQDPDEDFLNIIYDSEESITFKEKLDKAEEYNPE